MPNELTTTAELSTTGRVRLWPGASRRWLNPLDPGGKNGGWVSTKCQPKRKPHQRNKEKTTHRTQVSSSLCISAPLGVCHLVFLASCFCGFDGIGWDTRGRRLQRWMSIEKLPDTNPLSCFILRWVLVNIQNHSFVCCGCFQCGKTTTVNNPQV